MRYLFILCLFGNFYLKVDAQQLKTPADYVDPFIGVVKNGNCMPGPCLPHASVYPSPNTIKGNNGGYAQDQMISGFAQLHVQGTGGLKSYGNFLISPQIGLKIKEAEHQSPKTEEIATPYYYKVRLKKYDILCELSPSQNSVLYKFTFPANDSSVILLDVARKTCAEIGLNYGNVQISKDRKSVFGGGNYGNNWPDGMHNWNMYFYAELSEPAIMNGVFEDSSILKGALNANAKSKKLGAYLGFQTKANQVVYVKIAVSFVSPEHARELLHKEIPAWDFEYLKNTAKTEWNKYLGKISIEGTEEEKVIFYTHLFHAFVQPRNRTGNNLWNSNEDFWDDHYTMWDSWKTLFPLMCLINQDMVAANIRSFINRHKHNKYVAEAFINGKESHVGQGGNTVDNIIADAFVKNIRSVNWRNAYQIMKYNADSMRNTGYRSNGYSYYDEPTNYSWRNKAGSATISFAFNDYCIAKVAKGLGKKQDYEFYLKRSSNWKNCWNYKAKSDSFTGFIMARNQDGSFNEIDPKTGYNQHFYEATSWESSYEIPHDVPEMVRLMGGKDKFVERLQYALNKNLINFSNEPSFMTLWLFANENVGRPDLTSYYIRTKLLSLYTRDNLPGDDDQGAMASLYVFARLGFFPVAGTDIYYLHGGSYPLVTLRLPQNKKLVIKSINASPDNIYIQSVELNGVKLNRSWVKHKVLIRGGILKFVMTNKPVNYLN